MRDIETIESELRLLVAIHRLVREEEGRPPNARRIDELVEELAGARMPGLSEERGRRSPHLNRCYRAFLLSDAPHWNHSLPHSSQKSEISC